ncbi:MAG: toxin-antitoxin system, antitoxin component, Xre family protein [Oscillospiraceae bacterium]
MTNTKMLRDFIKDAGIKYGAVAKAANLTYQGFLNKMNNDSEFKVSEIKSISKFTNMPKDIRDEIFFA